MIWKIKSQSQVGYLFALPKYLTNREVRKEITKKKTTPLLNWVTNTYKDAFLSTWTWYMNTLLRQNKLLEFYTRAFNWKDKCSSSGLKPPLLTNSQYISYLQILIDYRKKISPDAYQSIRKNPRGAVWQSTNTEEKKKKKSIVRGMVFKIAILGNA